MAFTFKIDGTPVTFKDRKEAAAFLRDYAQESGGKVPKGGREVALVGESGFQVAKIVREFVGAMRHAGMAGIDTKQMMKIVGIKDPKAFGNRGKIMNRFLGSLGFDPKEVYSNAKNAEGKREWKAGPKSADVIDALNKLEKE